MTIQNRQQWLAVLAIGAVALLTADRLVLTPLTRSWKERSARLAQLRTSVADGERLLSREDTIRQRWNTMRAGALSNDVAVAESQVLKAFDRWSQESRVGITSLKPQWKPTLEDYTTIECRVDAFGNLGTLTRFLHCLEKDPLALKVDSLDITSRDDDGQQLTLALQVSGLLFTTTKRP